MKTTDVAQAGLAYAELCRSFGTDAVTEENAILSVGRGPQGDVMTCTCSHPLCPDCVVVKVCPCGIVHTASQWVALDYVGMWSILEDETLELRNCHCSSTITVAA